jgi:hypothetical protein
MPERKCATKLLRYYILDDQGEPVPCDLLTWARWFETADRQVAHDIDEATGIRVSTVFLGFDQSFRGGGPPILWESMVFGGTLDGSQRRYSSRREALNGHRALCEEAGAALREAADVNGESEL